MTTYNTLWHSGLRAVMVLVALGALAACSWTTSLPPKNGSKPVNGGRKPPENGGAEKPDPSPPKMVKLKLTLPPAQFEGTPQDVREQHMEKPLGRARPPILVPEGTTNVALNKPVTASEAVAVNEAPFSQVVDGDKDGNEFNAVILGPDPQYVQIDLGEAFEISAIIVWHYHGKPLVFHDVVVLLANDKRFVEGVQTLFNNDFDNSAGLGKGRDRQYVETNEGKLIEVKGKKGRFVRLYTNGNNVDDRNFITEVEVYGKPAK